MKRILLLLSALIMPLPLGATYSWSVYVHHLRELTGLTQGLVQLPFTTFYFAFPATTIVSGMLLPRLGPRRSAAIGGMLFGTGWIVASFGDINFLFTVIGIGLIAGIGVGFAYIVPIAVMIRWFPEQKGLMTGISVVGFGAGAALVGRIGADLMAMPAATPFTTFRILGCAFAGIVVLCASAMRFPETEQSTGDERLSYRSLIRQTEFRLLYLAMIVGLSAGLAINANLKELRPGGTPDIGVTAVSLFALANAAGRLSWGAAFDRFRSRPMLVANLTAQGLLLATSPLLLKHETGVYAFSILSGFNYGGVLVLYASTAARIWGPLVVGQVYGLLFSSNILAAPAPMIAGWWFDISGSFLPSILAIAVLLFGAAGMLAFRMNNR
jgi:OFA family oxalate/formate antiporter-like MFS transporter